MIHLDPTTATYGVSLIASGLFGWTLWSWWLATRTIFDPYTLFLTSLFLFNGGQFLLEVLGLNPHGILDGRFPDEVVLGSGAMVVLSLAFCHLGALVAAGTGRRHRQPATGACDHRHALRTVGWALLSLSIIPWAMITREAFRTTMAAGYISLYEADAGTGLAAGRYVLATFMIPAALFLLAGAQGQRREKIAAIVVVAAASTTQLLLGYRATAVMPVCAFGWLWHRCESRLSAARLAACGVGFVGLIPLIGAIRALSVVDRFRPEVLLETVATMENPLVATIREMGGSLSVTAHTFLLVPDLRPFDYGQSYMFALLTLVPNLFWSVHPAIAHGTLTSWLIWSVDRYTAVRQGTLGYSCIAEAFLNFGFTGVAAVMGIVGFGLGRLVVWAARSEDRRTLAMTAVLTAFILKVPRDESASIVRVLLWYAWVPYMVTRSLSAYAYRRHSAPQPSAT